MRGKKDLIVADLYDAAVDSPSSAYDTEADRMAFLDWKAAKRASGFLPMRGRKSDYSMLLNEEVLQKRPSADSSFMPMRGRKWFVPSAQSESMMAQPATANVWYHRYYYPVPLTSAKVKMADNRFVYCFASDQLNVCFDNDYSEWQL